MARVARPLQKSDAVGELGILLSGNSGRNFSILNLDQHWDPYYSHFRAISTCHDSWDPGQKQYVDLNL